MTIYTDVSQKTTRPTWYAMDDSDNSDVHQPSLIIGRDVAERVSYQLLL